jgi:hypothetical protein
MLETQPTRPHVSQSYGLRDRDLIFSESESANYVLRVRDMPDDERPRERLVQFGPGSLSVAELVSIV